MAGDFGDTPGGPAAFQERDGGDGENVAGWLVLARWGVLAGTRADLGRTAWGSQMGKPVGAV